MKGLAGAIYTKSVRHKFYRHPREGGEQYSVDYFPCLLDPAFAGTTEIEP